MSTRCNRHAGGMEHIVVGVDETPQSAAALRVAAAEADRRGGRLTAVLAWDLLSQHHEVPDAPFDPGYGEADAAMALETILDRTIGADAAGRVERLLVCDLPARALLDAACGADLLVVGSRDLNGLRRALEGSVSARCRRHPPCPLLIVHDDGRLEEVADRRRVGVG